MLKKKLIITAAVFWSAVIIINMIKPHADEQGIPEDRFWANKILWNGEFDLVAAGDSRTLIDISPVAMKEILPDLRIANYGFTAVCYTGDYLQSIAKPLDMESADKAILLGITPHSFIDYADEISGYEKWSSVNRTELWILRSSASFRLIFENLSHERILQFLNSTKGWLRVHHADGWIASRTYPENPQQLAKYYRNTFKREQVSAERIGILLEQVRMWREEGIRVLCFRAPVSREVGQIERELSGFDEARFKADLEAAGGIWLPDARAEDYYCYDASHLRYDSAVRYSRYLAQKIMDIRGHFRTNRDILGHFGTNKDISGQNRSESGQIKRHFRAVQGSSGQIWTGFR